MADAADEMMGFEGEGVQDPDFDATEFTF
jgi:hypothetical protein